MVGCLEAALCSSVEKQSKFIVIFLVILLGMPSILSGVWLNAGMLSLRKSVLEYANDEIVTYPFSTALQQSPEISYALTALLRAVTNNDSLLSARWALGRVWLGIGDVDAATNILMPLLGHVRFNELLYRDLLTALSLNGEFDAILDLYETAPLPTPTQIMSDTVALAYFRQGGNTKNGLVNAYRLRPNDLYANYYLWQSAIASGDTQMVKRYNEALTFFPLEAIAPTDDRLLDYTVEVMPFLFEQGVWDRSRLLNMVSFLVWQHSHNPSVGYLLQRLIALYPSEPEWFFYFGEMYHRQGNWKLAEGAYRQVLRVDPGYTQVYLRLGMVSEESCKIRSKSCEGLTEAADWYFKYYTLAPNDVLGLKKLVELYEFLGHLEAPTLRGELIARTDDRYIAAEMLGVPTEIVTLGANLVRNGTLEAWNNGIPAGWRLGVYLGATSKEGLYVTGEDPLNVAGKAARIITLWGGNTSDGNMTYAEYIGEGFLAKPVRYLVSLQYAYQSFGGTGLIYLGEYAQSVGLRVVHSGLVNTDAQWVNIHILTDGSSDSTSVIPLIRNWGIGQLWFRYLRIMPVICEENLCQ